MAEIRMPRWAHGLLDRPERYLVIKGGRGGTKSWGVCDSILLRCVQQPGFTAVVVREYKVTLNDGAIGLLWQRIRELGIAASKAQNGTTISFANGSRIFAMGAERNPENLRGLETADLAWCEEATSLSQDSIDLLDPSMRRPGAKLVFTFNPRFSDDAVYRMFCEQELPNSWVHHVNYGDYQSFRTAELDAARQRMRDTNDPLYAHVWEGQLRSSVGKMFDASAVAEEPLWPADASVSYVRSWDTAATAGGGDYTVGLRLAMQHGAYQIQDVQRGQLGSQDVEELVYSTARRDGYEVAVVMEQGGGDAGKRDARRWLQLLAGWDVRSQRVTGSKAERARGVAASLNGGLFSRPPGVSWWPALQAELVGFSENAAEMRGRHDDQVDALSQAYNWLVTKSSDFVVHVF